MSTPYENYQNLKKHLSGIYYKDYPLDRVLGSYLAELSWKYRIKKIRKYLLIPVKGKLNIQNSPTVVTYTVERDDYKHLIKGYFPNIKPENIKINSSKKDVITNIPYSIKYLIKSLSITKKTQCKWKEKLILTSTVSLALKVIDELESKHFHCSKYYAFNSSFMLESFLSYYFKKRNIETFSLQHGMYFNFINNIPIDVINYENCCSDYLLIWGNYSKEQISHLLPKDVTPVVYGHPYIGKNRVTSQINNDIYICLPRLQYWKESIQLINIVSDVFKEGHIIIRPHPKIKDRLTEYTSSNENIMIDDNKNSNYLLERNNFNAVIVFNSTMVFEALALGQNVLYFNKESEMDTNGLNSFSTKEELKNLLKNTSKEIKNGSYYYSNKFRPIL